MLAFSTDYISMRLAGKGPGCDATLFSLIDVIRTSKVQLHRRTARIFIDVIRLHCACGQNYSRLISNGSMASAHRAPMQQLTRRRLLIQIPAYN